MSHRGNQYFFSDEKAREVQRKLVYMRADAPPPKSLFYSSPKQAKNEDDTSPQRRVSKAASIHDLLMNDEKFLSLKQSFKHQLSPSTQNASTKYGHVDNHQITNSYGTSNLHPSPPPPSHSYHQMDVHHNDNSNYASPNHRTAHNILGGQSSFGFPSPLNSHKPDLSNHPLVQELSERGMTLSMKKRKMQTLVRKDVESTL